MREHCIADAIDRLQRGVNRGVEADGVVGAGDVVVDRGGNRHGAHSGLAAEYHRALKRALTADYDQRFGAVPLEVCGGERAAVGAAELRDESNLTSR